MWNWKHCKQSLVNVNLISLKIHLRYNSCTLILSLWTLKGLEGCSRVNYMYFIQYEWWCWIRFTSMTRWRMNVETLRLEDCNGNGDVELKNALTAHARLEKPTLSQADTTQFHTFWRCVKTPAICWKKTGKYHLWLYVFCSIVRDYIIEKNSGTI